MTSPMMETPAAAAPADDFNAAALKRRPDYSGLLYAGNTNSMLQLPHLQLNWRDLIRGYEDSRGKPIGDLGACFSTLALEARLRGEPEVVPLDVSFKVRRGHQAAIVLGMAPVLTLYRRPDLAPAGFELPCPIPEARLTESALISAQEQILARAITADISRIPRPDRYFSITIVHEAVPKHSVSAAHFLNEQLPEILRVTDREARIYPLMRYVTAHPKTPDERQEPAERVADYAGRLHAIAQHAGFSFEQASAFDYTEDLTLHSRGDMLLGIFTRR